MRKIVLLGAVLLGSTASPAIAQDSDGIKIKPILDILARYEHVNQPDTATRSDADALTIRARAGAEFILVPGLSLLAEAEGTLAVVDNYNDTVPGNGVEPYSVVADPENVELNRLQVAYTTADKASLTVGRQRINLGDQRFVGAVGWRQNEQTFDAVRVQSGDMLGPVQLDVTYSNSQRTIFGYESPNTAWEGNFILANAGFKLGENIEVTGLAYLLDYDAAEARSRFDSQTYGVRANGKLPLGQGLALTFDLTYANQSDYGEYAFSGNTSYDADYYSAAIGATVMGFGITAMYEELGSDNGREAFQTPLATAHKFNGWADLFLTTPVTGVRDYNVTLGKKFSGIKMLPGLATAVTYHQFDSDFGGIDYGSEWDAIITFKLAPVGVLIKYANYNADSFGVDTEKLWIQLAYSF